MRAGCACPGCPRPVSGTAALRATLLVGTTQARVNRGILVPVNKKLAAWAIKRKWSSIKTDNSTARALVPGIVDVVCVANRHDICRHCTFPGSFFMSNHRHRYQTKRHRDDPGDAGTIRQRQCLMCRTSFSSAWSGERICPSCKRKSLWSSAIRLPSSSRPV